MGSASRGTVIVGGFFGGLLTLGFLIYPDFGVSWDEAGIYNYGRLLLEHYAPGGPWETYSNLRFYGPVVPVLLALTERLSPSPEDAYPLGHLLLYVIFVAGVFAFYKLCNRQFGHWGWGLLGAALLVASPRVFSHAFVNPKDAPFMALFVIAVYGLVGFLDSRRRGWLLLCATATAVAIDTRVIGILLVALTVAALGAETIASTEARRARTNVLSLTLYAAVLIPLTILLWPFLWPNPLGNFLETLRTMSNFVEGPQATLYMGRLVPTAETPWHYVPVWMGITTPLPYLALFLVGLGKLLRARPPTAFKKRCRERFLYIYAAWLMVPLAAVIFTNAALYDEWRQLLFVYPALLLFAVAGAQTVLDHLSRRSVVAGRLWLALIVGAIAASAWQMVRLHPYQAVYFNPLTGGLPGAEGRFELDHWGLSYKEGLGYLLSTRSGTIELAVCNESGPAVDSAALFPDRQRLRYVGLEEADYAVCAPRTLQLDEQGRVLEPPFPYLPRLPTIHTVERDGVPILYIKRVLQSGLARGESPTRSA